MDMKSIMELVKDIFHPKNSDNKKYRYPQGNSHHAAIRDHVLTSSGGSAYLAEWEHRHHKVLHVLSYLIPLLILGYIVYMNILPFGYTGSLTLDVGTDGDMDSTKKIYLSDPNKVLTPVQRYGADTFREVTKEKPFYLNFVAPINIDKKTTVTLDMDYESDSPAYIEYSGWQRKGCIFGIY